MKRFMSTWDTFGISKSGVIFRAVARGVFCAIVLCGGCSNNGIGTVVGEGKAPLEPSEPPNILATATSSGSVKISWQSVSMATGYNLYRSTNKDAGYSKVGKTTSTEYTNTGLSSGTIYYYKATAYNNGGESPMSSYTSVTTIPGIPLNVTATAVSSSDITVRWFSVYGATGYKVYRWTKTDRSDASERTTSDTSYVDIGLTAGAIYYYSVSAYNGSGEGSPSPPINGKPRPFPPSNISVTATSDGNITVRWSSVNDVAGYTVYRNQVAAYGDDYKPIFTTTDTAYTNVGLLPGTIYYYRVSAYNSGGESLLSPYDSAMTVPAVPSNVSVIAASTDNITIGWPLVSGAIGYKVYRDSIANGLYTEITTVSSTSYTDIGLTSGATYYYRISAYNNSGESLKSQHIQAATIPAVPLDVSATETYNSNVIVRWSSVYGATGYKVYRGTSDDDYNSVYTVKGTSYTDTGLILGVTYYYRVSAVNSGGESSLSNYVSAMPYLEYTFGTLTDSRDGKTYNTVKIGNNKTWMVENLNYKIISNSWCYNNDESMCDEYGRLYNWTVAKNNACPNGWHLPSNLDWADLTKTVGGTGIYGDGGTAATKLKSGAGWDQYFDIPNGTDDFGFSALPAGYSNYIGGGSFSVGTIGYWWTNTEGDDGNAYYRSMKYNSENVSQNVNDKRFGMSVRCVQE